MKKVSHSKKQNNFTVTGRDRKALKKLTVEKDPKLIIIHFVETL